MRGRGEEEEEEDGEEEDAKQSLQRSIRRRVEPLMLSELGSRFSPCCQLAFFTLLLRFKMYKPSENNALSWD
jgi:hypothetical protein